jgi:nucleoporin GLE1
LIWTREGHPGVQKLKFDSDVLFVPNHAAKRWRNDDETMVKIDVSECRWSSDSEDESSVASFHALSWRLSEASSFGHRADGQSWDDIDDDGNDGECSTSVGATQQRFLDSLRQAQKRQHPVADEPGAHPRQEFLLQEFLLQDKIARRRVEEEQERLLRSLEERHRQQHAKDQAAVKQVVRQFQEELEEKERREQALKKEKDDKARAEIEAQLALEEAQLALEEAHRQAHRLVCLAAPQALENQGVLASVLARYNDELKPFCEDASSEIKGLKRSIKKVITLSVQQISATQEQVKRKSASLLEFISQQHGLHQKFALVTLASKMVSQCDAQVARLPSFAFPLGEVAVSVSRAFPDFLKLVLAMLQNECPLCVPMIYKPGPKAGKDLKYFEAMLHKVHDGKVESEEEYVSRMQGFVRLQAAMLQVDNDPQLAEISLGQAWGYVAWLLNSLPACRYTASALDAFLSVAGFRMFRRYGRQFVKMMAYVSTYFLRDLGELGDAGANAVASRLESYVGRQGYRTEPKGRTMPLRDESSQNRA